LRRQPRIGLALGSGSARGWAHIGAIRALEARGVKPDIICGSSVGALVGGAYASGELEKLESWVTGLAWTAVIRMMDVTWRGGLISGNRMFNFFRTMLFEKRDIADLPVKFGCVATELATGREVWLQHGDLLDAVRASCAIPGLFRPVVRDGVVLVDGGLVNPVPVSMCRAFGAELVIAIDLSWGKLGYHREAARVPIAPQEPSWIGRLRGRRTPRDDDDVRVPSIFEVFNTSLDIVEQRVARSRLAGEPADVLITPLLPQFGTMEYHRAAEAIAEGKLAVERMAPLLDQVLGQVEISP
jgi:NTE family protein